MGADLSLRGRRILILGEGGLGLALVVGLVRQDARIHSFSHIGCDVSNDCAVEDCFAENGPFDGVVNLAAVLGRRGAIDLSDRRSWADVVRTNLIGSANVCRHALRNGVRKIVLMSGGGATGPLPGYAAYAASKAGVVALAQTLAADHPNVDINAVAPGALQTPMGRKSGAKSFGDMQKAVDCIAWLLSDESNGISGRLVAAQFDDYKSWNGLSESAFRMRRSLV